MEKLLVSAGIRLIGLWWIFFEGGYNLYHIVVKHTGLLTTSSIPVAANEQAVIFDLLLGVAIILLAPVVALAIFGADKPQADKAK
jgi:hypothetical protein